MYNRLIVALKWRHLFSSSQTHVSINRPFKMTPMALPQLFAYSNFSSHKRNWRRRVQRNIICMSFLISNFTKYWAGELEKHLWRSLKSKQWAEFLQAGYFLIIVSPSTSSNITKFWIKLGNDFHVGHISRQQWVKVDKLTGFFLVV